MPHPSNTSSLPIFVSLVDLPIDTESLIREAIMPDCGAVLLFLGTTRQWTKIDSIDSGIEHRLEETDCLEYEAFEEMAIKQMQLLAEAAFEKWDIRRVAIVHRLGLVEVQQSSIAIVVSSPHRKSAFEAGEWLIDNIKRDVPIWKKDIQAQREPFWHHPVENRQVPPEQLSPNLDRPIGETDQ